MRLHNPGDQVSKLEPTHVEETEVDMEVLETIMTRKNSRAEYGDSSASRN